MVHALTRREVTSNRVRQPTPPSTTCNSTITMPPKQTEKRPQDEATQLPLDRLASAPRRLERRPRDEATQILLDRPASQLERRLQDEAPQILLDRPAPQLERRPQDEDDIVSATSTPGSEEQLSEGNKEVADSDVRASPAAYPSSGHESYPHTDHTDNLRLGHRHGGRRRTALVSSRVWGCRLGGTLSLLAGRVGHLGEIGLLHNRSGHSRVSKVRCNTEINN